jgi:hypothetical protein
MNRRIHKLRWFLADWLSWCACKLRGHRWYVADAWHGVPGNRVNELESQIRDQLIFLADFQNESDRDKVNLADECLGELCQMAGENWGHVWPKEGK